MMQYLNYIYTVLKTTTEQGKTKSLIIKNKKTEQKNKKTKNNRLLLNAAQIRCLPVNDSELSKNI